MAAGDIDQLVQAMATLQAQHGGSIPSSTLAYDQQLAQVIAASWRPVS